jgi:biopolymer transport protein ExbD
MKRRASGGGEEEEKIDISPLIDCVFILLIFFIVTTTFVEEEGVEVNKPESAAGNASDDESENVVISIDSQGNIINENTDETIGTSGIQPLIRNALNENAEVPVILQPADDSQAGILISVIDQALLAGVQPDKISITKEGTAQ